MRFIQPSERLRVPVFQAADRLRRRGRAAAGGDLCQSQALLTADVANAVDH